MNSYQDLNLRPANAIAKYIHIRFATCSDSERVTAYALYQNKNAKDADCLPDQQLLSYVFQ